ncbi:MAG: hypothetical protein J3R72DRAFT_524322 [Linnemannia gamsii]|nr:MAG: hypothetical protein J3R72DRAFT_524322 [Linnemannia gamsii]
MDSVTAQFFDLPEMTLTLRYFLTKSDVASLVRTCRLFKVLFEPWLYQDLILSSSVKLGPPVNEGGTSSPKYHGVFGSSQSVRALSRNACHVRRLTCGLEEIAYLFNCLLRNQGRRTAVSNSNYASDFATKQLAYSTLFTPLTRPSWIPAPNAPLPHCRVIPLVPMHHLAHLKVNFQPSHAFEMLRYRMLTSEAASRISVRHICWILQQSTHLTSLQFELMPIASHDKMQLLAVTIQSLLRLEKIDLTIRAEEKVWQEGFYKIFFALPPSIKECRLFGLDALSSAHFGADTDPRDFKQSDEDIESDLESEDGEQNRKGANDNEDKSHGSVQEINREHAPTVDNDQYLVPDIVLRDEPLTRLKKFVFWSSHKLTDEVILATLDHCPFVEHLQIPSVAAVGSELDSLAVSINKKCPFLHSLASSLGSEGPLLLAVMDTMPSQQLEEIEISAGASIFGNGTSRRVFGRHSSTLRKINLRHAFVTSMDLLVILELCESLEVLIQHANHGSGSFITLADAISVPWACKKIRRLDITIGLAMVSSQDPYYRRTAPVVLSTEERRQFADLEMFYRQTGNLVRLEYMDMRGMYLDHEGKPRQLARMKMHRFTFPAMLSLQDDTTGRPGYLDLLAGLVNLKELRGSVRVTTDEAQETVGEREMDWIGTHWPALRRVALFASNNDVRESFKRLRDILRPELSLVQYDDRRGS